MENSQIIIIGKEEDHLIVKFEAKPYCGVMACSQSLIVVGLAGG